MPAREDSYSSDLDIEFHFSNHPTNPKISELLNDKISCVLTDTSNLFQEENSKLTLVPDSWKLLKSIICDEIYDTTKKHDSMASQYVIEAKLRQADYTALVDDSRYKLAGDNQLKKVIGQKKERRIGLLRIHISVDHWWVPKEWNPHCWDDIVVNKCLGVELTELKEKEGDSYSPDFFPEDLFKSWCSGSVLGIPADKGETGEFNLTFHLLDLATKDKISLVKITTNCWPMGEDATLMNFNQHSQALADLCFDLWIAAGQPIEAYDPVAIEVGDSWYSNLRILSLLTEALNISHPIPSLDIMYISAWDVYPLDKFRSYEELLDRICRRFDIAIIIRQTDAEKIGFSARSFKKLGFQYIGKQGWFVRFSIP